LDSGPSSALPPIRAIARDPEHAQRPDQDTVQHPVAGLAPHGAGAGGQPADEERDQGQDTGDDAREDAAAVVDAQVEPAEGEEQQLQHDEHRQHDGGAGPDRPPADAVTAVLGLIHRDRCDAGGRSTSWSTTDGVDSSSVWLL
jgi:hypothetical protein